MLASCLPKSFDLSNRSGDCVAEELWDRVRSLAVPSPITITISNILGSSISARESNAAFPSTLTPIPFAIKGNTLFSTYRAHSLSTR